MITEFCTGCRACEQLCPKQCISMITDEEGFLQAKIDETVCIKCGICKKKCPQNNIPNKHFPIRTIAARYKNNEILKKSASGGAFAGISTYILNNGGIVFGVAFQSDWIASHIACKSINDLEKIQSSKYVQSNTNNTYSIVREYLENGNLVLYSGTGCQIAGLRSFLKKDYENLITIDLICHGVSSPLLFQKYITWLEKKEKGKILFYNFRDKTSGWGLGYKTKTKTKTKTYPAIIDPYYYHFLEGNTYRECCYKCNYCTKDRVSDITIGDYWGIEKEHPKFYSTKGVSAILINTPKGKKLFSNCENTFYIQESTFDQIAKENHNLIYPTTRKPLRDNIYNKLNDKNYFDVILSPPNNLKNKIKAAVPMQIRLLIKHLKRIINLT